LVGTEIDEAMEEGSKSEKSEAKNGFGSGIANGNSPSNARDQICFQSSGMSVRIDYFVKIRLLRHH
jgi:hypothetical protein